ncbi:unnamed protein product [Gordionus sp. m RMFG-2023]|uniref:uncharacterized protein LOC135929593 n=1 Tax=Gordionus sp. m RMFG-2023 TaxID=3053472 RepID=UPI0030E19540
MDEWVIDYFINVARDYKWSFQVDNFVKSYQINVDNVNDLTENMNILHEYYKHQLEPVLNDFLSESEMEYTQFANICRDPIYQTKIKNYQDLLYPIMAIYDIQIFELMLRSSHKPSDLISLLPLKIREDLINQELYLEQILELSKHTYELREQELTHKFESDIEKTKMLSKNEYLIYQKRLKIERKMLEKALELSIKEIELREIEERAYLTGTSLEKITNNGNIPNVSSPLPDSEQLLINFDDENVPNTSKSYALEQQSLDRKNASSNEDEELKGSQNSKTDILDIPQGNELNPSSHIYETRNAEKLSLQELKARKLYLLDRYDKITKKLQNPSKTYDDQVNTQVQEIENFSQTQERNLSKFQEELNAKLREELLKKC